MTTLVRRVIRRFPKSLSAIFRSGSNEVRDSDVSTVSSPTSTEAAAHAMEFQPLSSGSEFSRIQFIDDVNAVGASRLLSERSPRSSAGKPPASRSTCVSQMSPASKSTQRVTGSHPAPGGWADVNMGETRPLRFRGGQPVRVSRFSLSRFPNWLRAVFLPIGYPESVPSTYLSFHFWQSLETLAVSCIGVLCNQAMLESLGVGEGVGSALGAVAIQWVLKDGLGEVGKLFFTEKYSVTFDSYPKFWKFAGEVMSSVGSFLMLCTALVTNVPYGFLLFASLGNLMRCLHYLIWSSTHVWFTKHFAIQRNIGDLSAKADSQMSVAHLGGMVLGIALLGYSHEANFLFFSFLLLTPVHWFSVWRLLRSAQFQVLNNNAATAIALHFQESMSAPDVQTLRRTYLTWTEQPRPRWKNDPDQWPMIEWCVPLESVVRTEVDALVLQRTFRNERYVFAVRTDKTPSKKGIRKLWNQRRAPDHLVYSVALHADASTTDVMQCILHIVRYHRTLRFGNVFGSPDPRISSLSTPEATDTEDDDVDLGERRTRLDREPPQVTLHERHTRLPRHNRSNSSRSDGSPNERDMRSEDAAENEERVRLTAPEAVFSDSDTQAMLSVDQSAMKHAQKSLLWTKLMFPEIRFQMERHGWDIEELSFPDTGRRAVWNRHSSAPHLKNGLLHGKNGRQEGEEELNSDGDVDELDENYDYDDGDDNASTPWQNRSKSHETVTSCANWPSAASSTVLSGRGSPVQRPSPSRHSSSTLPFRQQRRFSVDADRQKYY